MSSNIYSYDIKLKRGYAFLNLQMGRYNPNVGLWQVSRSTHKEKNYFKSLEAAKIFIEINFEVDNEL